MRTIERTGQFKRDLFFFIYRLPDTDTLQLVRMGSHSELGL
jgi:mRNA-degrading endonuclease YafQ of YafQ-DinJ toxin-antitoxin module